MNTYEEEMGCHNGWHSYSEITCPECGQVYCWQCAANTGESREYGTWAKCPQCRHMFHLRTLTAWEEVLLRA